MKFKAYYGEEDDQFYIIIARTIEEAIKIFKYKYPEKQLIDLGLDLIEYLED